MMTVQKIAAILAGLTTAALATSAAADEACGHRYVAKAGETMRGIAYKCGVPLADLKSANPYLVGRRGLRSGVIVSIPMQASGHGLHALSGNYFHTPSMETVPAGPRLSQYQGGMRGPHYLIEPGDTLGGIAQRYNTTVWDLMLVNPELNNPHRLLAGAYLRLPYGVGTPAPRNLLARTSGEDVSVVPLPTNRGTDLSIQLGDFPANKKVKIGLGTSSQNYAIITGGKTDRFGRLTTKVGVPKAFAGKTGLVVVAKTLDEQSVAVSQSIAMPLASSEASWAVSAPVPREKASTSDRLAVGTRISFEGVVTGEGSDCPAVRDDEGRLFSLTATDVAPAPGEIVRVRGIVAPANWCANGVAIATSSVDRKSAQIETRSGGSELYDAGPSRKPSKDLFNKPTVAKSTTSKSSGSGVEVLSVERPFWSLKPREYVRGLVVAERGGCTMVRGENGQLYAISARLGAVTVGDEVELLGSTEARDPCGSGIGFDVEEARKYSKYGS